MNNERSEETSRLTDCMQGETRTSGDRDFATMKSAPSESRRSRETGEVGEVKVDLGEFRGEAGVGNDEI